VPKQGTLESAESEDHQRKPCPLLTPWPHTRAAQLTPQPLRFFRAAAGRHRGRSASFKTQRPARPCVRASSAACGRARAIGDVQGRRRSLRCCWPPRARAPDAGPRQPLLVAIGADSRRSKPRDLPVRVLKRAAKPLVGPDGHRRYTAAVQWTSLDILSTWSYICKLLYLRSALFSASALSACCYMDLKPVFTPVRGERTGMST